MSQDGVHNNEMDLPEEPEAQLPNELVGDMRLAYGARLPRVGTALRSLLENGLPRAETEIHRSFRGSLVRLAAVSLALFGTMSGLAVAGALPAPVQNAVSGVAQTVGFDLPDSQPTAEPPAATAAGSWEQGTNGVGGNGGGAKPSDRPVPEASATTAPTDSEPAAVADGPPASTPTPSTVAADRPRGATPGTTGRADDNSDPNVTDEPSSDDTTPTTLEPDVPLDTTTTSEPETTTTTTTPPPDPPDGGGAELGTGE